jgi:hypothetical protein
MACKLNSMLMPQMHWIVSSKIIPSTCNVYKYDGYLDLETASFSFAAASFVRIAAMFRKISGPLL